MSFWTTLSWVRTEPINDLTCSAFARFMEQLSVTGLVDKDYCSMLSALLGKPMGVDKEDEYQEVIDLETEAVVVSRSIAPKWDIDIRSEPEDRKTVQDVCRELRKHNDTLIYRMHVDWTSATDAVCSQLTRPACEDNDKELCLSEVFVHAGPVESYTLKDDAEERQPRFAGWFDFSLGGYGCMFPWEPEDLIQRAENSPAIRQAKIACSDMFDGEWHWAINEG